MSNFDQPRVAKGTPKRGGQWSSKHTSEAVGVDLAEPDAPDLKEISRGCFEVTDTSSKPEPGANLIRISVRGYPELKAHAGAAGSRYGQFTSDRDLREELADMDGKKTSVLVQSQNGSVQVREGTVGVGDDGSSVYLLAKGSHTKGTYLYGKPGAPRVLDWQVGYGHAVELAGKFRDVEADTPNLVKSTFDDIPCTEDRRDEVAAVFVIDHPGFDGDQDGRGCVFFATERDPEDVANGYFVCPPSSGLFSENGSFTVDQLSRWGGRVSGYRPGSLTFRDAMHLADLADPYKESSSMEPLWDALSKSSRP